jgi:hypothetical protein
LGCGWLRGHIGSEGALGTSPRANRIAAALSPVPTSSAVERRPPQMMWLPGPRIVPQSPIGTEKQIRPLREYPIAVRFHATGKICINWREMVREFRSPQSAACSLPPRRAYRPPRSCGRVAEGGGLLNRYRVVKPYRGFESLRLRQSMFSRLSGDFSSRKRTRRCRR